MAATASFPANTALRTSSTVRFAAPASPSLWTVLGQALQMAHLVGESGPVSSRQLRQVKALAGRL
ncbi:MAG: hypothetical protein JWP36_2266 [Paucimonas sp.]|nr:hypothetical protein [Paucimonas sp.]